MKIFEIFLKNTEYADGCYHKFVIVAEDADSAFDLAIHISEYGTLEKRVMEFRDKDQYEIKEIGISNESKSRFVCGKYEDVCYDNE
jgi:hypothetical protein